MTDPIEAVREQIYRHVEAKLRAEDAAIEKACEQALQVGSCGVLVLENADGSITVGPHQDVPYGWIQRYQPGAHPDFRE